MPQVVSFAPPQAAALRTVAVLCVLPDSVYLTLPGVEAYDEARDARTFAGGMPVVAHPPCRLWGILRHCAKSADPDAEKALALWCVDQVRRFGGVLEHPAFSTLWDAAGLPRPGERAIDGSFTLAAPQMWWGHRAEKNSWFFVAGLEPWNLPPLPFKLGEAERTITTNHRYSRKGVPGFRTECTRRERHATPPRLAEWLIETARRTWAPEATP